MATSREKLSLHARLSTLQMHEASAWIRFTCLSCFPDKTLGVLQNSPQPIKISIDTGRQRQRGLGAHHRVFGQHLGSFTCGGQPSPFPRQGLAWGRESYWRQDS
jgi:hypothetical protein